MESPRWRDAHLHLAAHGEELDAVSLRSCRSVGECLEMLARAAADAPEDAWISARHARVESWDGRRWPSARELDEATGGRCAFVQSFDHHALAASTRAMERTRVLEYTGDGVIERDAGGHATGLLLEGAANAFLGALPAKTDAEVRGYIERAQADLLSRGIVEVHDMFTTAAMARVLQEMERDGSLRMTVWLYATPEHFEEVRGVLGAPIGIGRGDAGGRVCFRGMKLFTDGTLNSRTAHMLHPFAEPIAAHPCGTPLLDDGFIREAMIRGAREGFDVTAHAIGDGAVRRMLDLYESLDEDDRGLTLRIEHAQFVDEADVERFTELSAGRGRVIASMQPCHLLADIEALHRLVPERIHRAFPVRDLVEAAGARGVRAEQMVWFGSDTPVVDPSPSDNVQAAVHRRRAGMPADAMVAAAQAVDEAMAVRLMRSAEG